MKNPRSTLLTGLTAIVLVGGMMLFRSEEASTTLRTIQFALLGLGVVAVIGALVQMSRK